MYLLIESNEFLQGHLIHQNYSVIQKCIIFLHFKSNHVKWLRHLRTYTLKVFVQVEKLWVFLIVSDSLFHGKFTVIAMFNEELIK
jgi:hypothetical protein